MSSLLTIEQGENESLQSFITRFNKEALTVDEVDDKLLLAAFHNEVNSDLFIHKLYEKEHQSMAELFYSAQNFMNAENAIIAKKRKRAKRMEANPMRHGHDTDEFYDLKQQIENIITQEKLRNFLRREHKDEKLKWKVEESSRPPLKEKSYYKRKLNKSVVQVQEDVSESSAECLTL